MANENARYPTMLFEALMISCIIDAMKRKDVAFSGITGAFMQKEMEGTVKIHLDGIMAEMLTKIDPDKYDDKVVIEGGNKVIYKNPTQSALWDTCFNISLMEISDKETIQMGV